MVAKIWEFSEIDTNQSQSLQSALGIHSVLCDVLVSRGIDTFDKAKSFFRPLLSDLHDPFLMKGMTEAVARISAAVLHGEHIRIYGDYDVDGTTSVAVVVAFLQKNMPQETPLSYYVPNRYTEGYGISRLGIDDAIENQCTLMIALDCGIKANEMVQYANDNGLDIIICDHHLPSDVLPAAVAILNPKQKDCGYPFKELSGCGIGFKLISALAEAWDIPRPDAIYDHLDLLAASIASDIVPMDGENRTLAYYGLQKVNENPCLAVRILKETSGVRSKMNISNLVFIIGPRINAAGRMNDAKKAIDLFVTEDPVTALALARALQTDNKERIELDRSITQQALDMLDDPARLSQKSTVLHHPSWHKGVIGIVASRVIDHHYKPTIVLTTSNGRITGSARSVAGFDIHEAISACAPFLENYGGHQFAAGLTLLPENLANFQAAFEQEVQAKITTYSLHPRLYIDALITLDCITLPFMNILEQFEPCGPKNSMPLFVAKGVKDSGKTRIVKDSHLQLHLQQGKASIKGIAFGMADLLPRIQTGRVFDIAFHIERNEWNGTVKAEIRVLDIQFPEG